MDDSIQIRCTKCKSKFRDRARKVQVGYSRECPSCEVVMFFQDESPDNNIREALNNAQRLRRLLREEEHDKPANHTPFIRRR